MFISEGRKSFLQEAAIEIRMMGNDEDDPAKQIVDGVIVNPMTGDNLIGDAADFRYEAATATTEYIGLTRLFLPHLDLRSDRI
jgi:hypothetical protein